MKTNKTLAKWTIVGICAGLALTLYLVSIISQKEPALPPSLSETHSQKMMQTNDSNKHTAMMKDSNDQIDEKSGKPHQHSIITPDDTFLQTHTERIPNFAKKYTAINLSSGKWSSADTWQDGQIPRDGDIVRIAANTKVVYDIASDTRISSIGVAGRLDFSTNITTRLRVTNLMVYPGGSLQIGNSTKPVSMEFSAEIIINDTALDTGTVEKPGLDPGQYANGILVWGEITLHGASITPTFLRLAETPLEGSRELVLSSNPEGWHSGELILIPGSRQISEKNLTLGDSSEGGINTMWETARITEIAGDRIQLAEPIIYSHHGATDLSGDVISLHLGEKLLPHVANISRNIIIKSENPVGTRGHTIFFRNSSVKVANTLFKDLGRTTIAKLDNTETDGDNSLLKIGRNQIARYPIHFHHHTDPGNVSGVDYEYRLTGNVVETAPRWGIVIHSTHFGLVKDNIVFNAAGAGIATEDGSETGNHFENNFIVGVHGSGQSIDAHKPREGLGHEGAGFWLGSDNNTVINNVVAVVRDSGYTLFRSKSAKAYPKFPRLDKALLKRKSKLFRFQNNEVYGSAGSGIKLWDDKKRSVDKDGVATLENTVIWHSRNGVKFDYHADHYDIDGLIVRGDLQNIENSSGILANLSKRAVIRNASIEYVSTGIEGGGGRNLQLDIENSNIIADTGIRIFRGSSWGDRQPLKIKNVTLRHLAPSVSVASGKLIELMTGSNYKRHAIPTKLRPIHVSGFQGDSNRNFHVFYPDQAPGFVIPQNPDNSFGCPLAGLTNKQCLQQFGIAMGGELASCNTSITGIDGFSCTDH